MPGFVIPLPNCCPRCYRSHYVHLADGNGMYCPACGYRPGDPIPEADDAELAAEIDAEVHRMEHDGPATS